MILDMIPVVSCAYGHYYLSACKTKGIFVHFFIGSFSVNEIDVDDFKLFFFNQNWFFKYILRG